MNSVLFTMIAPVSVEVAVFLVVLGVSLIMYKRGNQNTLKRMVLTLVIEAEKQLGDGTGELKYQQVVANLYYRMPIILRWLFTQKQIDGYIEDAVQYLKMYLSHGKDLNGIE